MSEYHKINSIFKRDMSGNKKLLIEGDWASPEFEYLSKNIWSFTEKVDGTNIRIIINNGLITFGGRTDNALIPAQLVARLNELFLPLSDKFREVFPGGQAVLYGEGYGAKIQKCGANYRPDQDFVLFDVRVGHFWLRRNDVHDVANKLGLLSVPIIGEGTLYDAVSLAKEGIKSSWGDFQAEGIVARPIVEMNARDGSRIIAKIKCCDFRSA